MLHNNIISFNNKSLLLQTSYRCSRIIQNKFSATWINTNTNKLSTNNSICNLCHHISSSNNTWININTIKWSTNNTTNNNYLQLSNNNFFRAKYIIPSMRSFPMSKTTDLRIRISRTMNNKSFILISLTISITYITQLWVQLLQPFIIFIRSHWSIAKSILSHICQHFCIIIIYLFLILHKIISYIFLYVLNSIA